MRRIRCPLCRKTQYKAGKIVRYIKPGTIVKCSDFDCDHTWKKRRSKKRGHKVPPYQPNLIKYMHKDWDKMLSEFVKNNRNCTNDEIEAFCTKQGINTNYAFSAGLIGTGIRWPK